MSLKILANFLLIPFALLLLGPPLAVVECRTTFSIGVPVIGDQLLVKDVLQVRPTGRDARTSVGFQYAISEPITYIEIASKENVFAYVSFSYHNDLVAGTITTPLTDEASSSNSTTSTPLTNPEPLRPFDVQISIYGFNRTILNVDPVYILNRDQDFNGVLEPDHLNQDDDGEADYYVNADEEDALEQFNEDNIDAEQGSPFEVEPEEDWEDGDMDDDFEHKDKIIEVGHRQKGDYMIYSTYQTSAATTEHPTNHSLVFYYIDSDYITSAKFIVFDHFNDKTPAVDYSPPTAEYSHYSPNTLKAVITDPRATNLFVQMFLYGYKSKDLPVDYVPPFAQKNSGGIERGVGGTTESPLQRLKMLMKAQLHGDHAETTTDDVAATASQKEAAVGAHDVGQLQISAKGNMECPPSTGGANAMAAYLSIRLWTIVAVISVFGRINLLF